MLRGPSAKVVAALMALALLGSACSSRDDDDASTDSGSEDDAAAGESSIDTADCVSDPTEEVGDTIKLVSSYPQSGLTAAFAEIARGWKAYFDKVNAEGGVDFGGKTVTIEYDDADDQYNAAETAANIDEMVGPEGDGAFAVFSVVGTANNLAIRDTLDELCVPNVFAATGSPAWGNTDYPWMIGSTLSPYPLESEIFAELIEVQQPGAQVAMLVQDDDFGAAYEETLRAALEGGESGAEVVAVEKYSTGASEVGAQITSLASSGADGVLQRRHAAGLPRRPHQGGGGRVGARAHLGLGHLHVRHADGPGRGRRQRRVQRGQPQGPAEPRVGCRRGDGRVPRHRSPVPARRLPSRPTPSWATATRRPPCSSRR